MADVFTPELTFGPYKSGIMTPTAPGQPYRTMRVDAFAPSSLFASGETGGYWSARNSTLFQNSNGTTAVAVDDPVGYASDIGNANTNPLLMATAGRRPLLKVVDTTLRAWLFDGIDDTLRALFTLGANSTVMLAYRLPVYSGGNAVLLGGGAADIDILESGPSPNIGVYAGAVDPVIAGAVVGVSGVLSLFSTGGANTTLALNNAAPTSGNPGAFTLGGITLAGAFNDVLPCNEYVFATFAISRALTAPEKANMLTYMGLEAGLSL
jgi:hypothetical protein